MEKNTRLHSLDALRGFDMFFIMGGEAFFVALYAMFPNVFFGAIEKQMHHVEWNGFACYDMIFPLFLFIAGISFPFSLAKSRSKGASEKALYANIIRRGLTLILLGAIYNGLFSFDFANVRYASVLGRIGIAWMFAAIIYLNTKPRMRLIIGSVILLGYWALLALCPAPDALGEGVFSLNGNLVGYVDRMILPGRLHQGTFDPEGLLSALPAIVTAMLGMFAGELVQKEGLSGAKKTIRLIAIGAALVLIGWCWDFVFPINKKLWTSSYVCFVGGLSYMLFALFYYVIDVCNFKKWTLFFTVIGMNSITIYLAQRIIGFRKATEFFGVGVYNMVPEDAKGFVEATTYILVCWVFLYFLYRKKIFLKV